MCSCWVYVGTVIPHHAKKSKEQKDKEEMEIMLFPRILQKTMSVMRIQMWKFLKILLQILRFLMILTRKLKKWKNLHKLQIQFLKRKSLFL